MLANQGIRAVIEEPANHPAISRLLQPDHHCQLCGVTDCHFETGDREEPYDRYHLSH